MTTQAPNGADLLCETLLANDIDVCFANPGTSEMHFVAALDRQPRMRCVLGLFEGVVTGAADGYARMADKPAATLLHLGPGLANGLANLHNARRARTPMVNVVGDHATYHLAFDAPLTSDIESLARPMSHWVGRAETADGVGAATEAAIRAARTAPGGIATLILPADAAWNATATAARPTAIALPRPAAPDPALIRAAAEAIRAARRPTILATGLALRDAPLRLLDGIGAKTGARIMAQQSNGRMQRGAGRVAVDRVAYVVDQAVASFAETDLVVLVGAKAPVGFFAYPGKPSSMLPEGCRVIELAAPDGDLVAAIEALAAELGTAAPRLAARQRPDAVHGALTPDAIALALARHMPAEAIVCDESVSSGRDFFRSTAGAEPHDFLQLTGGAIGIGIPLATGAAIACPGRKVVTLQADGSGMYTVQGLWTQARERLDVITIVFANRRYAILHGELTKVGAGKPGRNASRMLDLDDPALDWVKLAAGMGVEAARADSAEAFDDILAAACRRPGPFLIEAVI
ncbi:acetolactate synthase large subunit [Prosthecomicrobium hirschii]|uniref:acetolactate synthase large subunit n=1 Tax=Prosthecodimorpha hirschii TaxID=665126 RepID=UPI00112842DF|nr:acetolactate synthase large subunit [Prosthecomicrobium hirschii]TPQ51871.1 acetolactate synthase large subunit [Prosthecomicrobium hirschii]